MGYDHTQMGHFHWLLFPLGIGMAGSAWLVPGPTALTVLFWAMAALFLLLAAAFATLRVRDDFDALLIQFGPLPLFRKRIAYQDISAVQPDRTNLLDGWGIHYVPGRGSTFNLWGFGCIRLDIKGRVIRVGTDEPDRLAQFVASKLP